MGKKSRAKAGNSEAKPVVKRKSGKNNLWLILGGSVIMVVIVWFTLQSTNKDSGTPSGNTMADKMDALGKGPVSLIATMSPALFQGRARAAYQAAKDVPEILAQLPCFCGCMTSPELAHKSNLFCFADSHGNICELCQTIALEAKEMNRKGIPVETIRSNILATYGSARM